MSRFSRRLVASFLLAGLTSCWLIPPSSASAYTTESPQVKEMVRLGATYLQGKPLPKELGGACLVALAIYKSGFKNDKKIAEAVAQCQRAAGTYPKAQAANKDVYNLGIAIIFLAELNAERYAKEIDVFLKQLVKRQRPDGSWSYPPRSNGDTSITQYGVLGLWAAKNTDRQVDLKSVDACTRWLMRTQDTTGAWSYIGVDPGNYTRINQRVDFNEYEAITGRVSPSMVVAGLGSLYMAADMLGYKDTGKRLAAERDLLKVIKLVSASTDEGATAGRIFGRAIPDGEKYYRGNCKTVTNHWQYYYLYGMERYESFREQVLKLDNEEPAWYNKGVDFMKRKQVKGGSWVDAKGGPYINTAFAILFLVRSTKTTIRKLMSESLSGGKGLPASGDLRMNSKGKIVTNPLAKTMSEMLALLDEEQSSEEVMELMSRQFNVALEGDDATLAEQSARLRQFVTHKDWDRRLIAVQTISQTRDLDNAPALIFALTDPRREVIREARDGLRYISRRFKGFGLDDFSEGHPTAKEKAAAHAKWKAWYLSVRPDRAVDFEQY